MLRRLLQPPSVLSLVVAAGFFVVFEIFLHPGYAINDDLKIISITAGFPGVEPAPFLVFSNVLLGLFLTPLYALKTGLNWEMLFFSGINFLSLWAVLHVLFSASIAARGKLLGAAIILACAAYFALNITFTSTAAFSCFAGVSLVMAGASDSTALGRRAMLCGLLLIVVGSLIRIEMLALILPVFIPLLIFMSHHVNLRLLLLACFVACVLVLGAYAFDRLYVRAHPSWNLYYFYNKTAQKLQDAHRLENIGRQIRHIGWSGNDQELFARSFFPDAGIYSVERIQYLIDHVSGTSQNPAYTIQAFFGRLAMPAAVLSLLAIAATWLWMLTRSPSVQQAVATVSISAISLTENLGLIWFYKNPDYVLWSLLAQGAILGVLVLNWPGIQERQRSIPPLPSHLIHGVGIVLLLLVLATVGLAVNQSLVTSGNNLRKQQVYQRILADLEELQAAGKIADNALIVSPAHGLPMDWSNPFVLELPRIAYLDSGWTTFSPPYEQVLHEFDIQSLPDALYEKNNVYLMTKQIFQVYLGRYYQEHEGITVSFEPIYSMPNPDGVPGYEDVQLYKVIFAR